MGQEISNTVSEKVTGIANSTGVCALGSKLKKCSISLRGAKI